MHAHTLTQGAVGAADARGKSGALRPFAGLARRLESTLGGLGLKLPGSQHGGAGGEGGMGAPLMPEGPAGPVSGLLYIDGRLGGSTTAPQAALGVHIEQGAVGSMRLGKVSA